MAVTTDKPTRHKRLIVCCDGTWQSSVGFERNIPSNVTRLARSFVRTDDTNPDDVWDQVVYYDAGIGTGSITTLEAIRQGSVGSGFSGNVIEAYNFLVLNYKPGDKIYCFGFSRGAYTARAVAGLVNDIGIISPRDMQDFPELYQKYEWPNKDRPKNDQIDTSKPNWFRKSEYYREWITGVPVRSKEGRAVKMEGTRNMNLYERFPHSKVPEETRQVEVVGVFDTVGSLGVPDAALQPINIVKAGIKWATDGGTTPGFHNVSLSRYTRHAFHALALDEYRGPFTPTLWHLPTASAATTTVEDPKHEEASKKFEELDSKYREHAKADLKDKQKDLKDLNEAWAAMIECEIAREQCAPNKSELEQVWFPGYHCNIGGGNSDALEICKDDLEQIALISFAWMCDKLRSHLKFEDKLHKRTVGDRMAMVNPILAEIEDEASRDFGNWKIFKPLWKAADAHVPGYNCPKKAVSPLTVSGWATGTIVDSFTTEYIVAGKAVRTPGRYRHLKDEKTNKEIDLGETNERIHPCVAYRMAMLQRERLQSEPLRAAEKPYNPDALKELKRVHHNGNWYWADAFACDMLDKQKELPTQGLHTPVIELQVDEKLRFSQFMAKDTLKYLDALVINKTRTGPQPKGVVNEKQLATSDEVCATSAMKFLAASKLGKAWKPENATGA